MRGKINQNHLVSLPHESIRQCFCRKGIQGFKNFPESSDLVRMLLEKKQHVKQVSYKPQLLGHQFLHEENAQNLSFNFMYNYQWVCTVSKGLWDSNRTSHTRGQLKQQQQKQLRKSLPLNLSRLCSRLLDLLFHRFFSLCYLIFCFIHVILILHIPIPLVFT